MTPSTGKRDGCIELLVVAMLTLLFLWRVLDGAVAAFAPHTEIRRLQRIEQKIDAMQPCKP